MTCFWKIANFTSAFNQILVVDLIYYGWDHVTIDGSNILATNFMATFAYTNMVVYLWDIYYPYEPIAVPWGTTIPWLSHKVEISLNITPISTRRVSIDYIRWAQPPHTSKHKNLLFIIFEEWDDGMLACSHNDLNLANSKVYKDIPIKWLNPWLHEIHAVLRGTAIRFIWPNNFHQ